MAETVMPWLVSIFGIILSAGLGMAVKQLTEIRTCMTRLDTRVFEHITKPGIHESGVEKIAGEIKALVQVSQALHSRVDRMEEVRG